MPRPPGFTRRHASHMHSCACTHSFAHVICVPCTRTTMHTCMHSHVRAHKGCTKSMHTSPRCAHTLQPGCHRYRSLIGGHMYPQWPACNNGERSTKKDCASLCLSVLHHVVLHCAHLYCTHIMVLHIMVHPAPLPCTPPLLHPSPAPLPCTPAPLPGGRAECGGG